jgi:hypothetical protein
VRFEFTFVSENVLRRGREQGGRGVGCVASQ